MKSSDLTKYAPAALGAFSGAVAALCLWVAVALMRVDGAGLVAFTAISGALFWGSGVAMAVLFWIEMREREKFEARREELRQQLRQGVRRTA